MLHAQHYRISRKAHVATAELALGEAATTRPGPGLQFATVSACGLQALLLHFMHHEPRRDANYTIDSDAAREQMLTLIRCANAAGPTDIELAGGRSHASCGRRLCHERLGRQQ